MFRTMHNAINKMHETNPAIDWGFSEDEFAEKYIKRSNDLLKDNLYSDTHDVEISEENAEAIGEMFNRVWQDAFDFTPLDQSIGWPLSTHDKRFVHISIGHCEIILRFHFFDQCNCITLGNKGNASDEEGGDYFCENCANIYEYRAWTLDKSSNDVAEITIQMTQSEPSNYVRSARDSKTGDCLVTYLSSIETDGLVYEISNRGTMSNSDIASMPY